MPQEDNGSGQVNKALKIFSVKFITHNQAAKVEKPGEEPFDFPAFAVATQRASVLRGLPPVDFVGCDQFNAVVLHEAIIEPVTVIGFVADQSLRHIRHDPFDERFFHQCHFRRRSAFRPQGERQTMAVGNAHDFGAFAALGFADQPPPFLAGTNVPSTKHSLKSSPPASLRCCASVSRIFSSPPERTQCWKRRWAVWYEPYRGGKSCHGAPVRKIHRMPLNTLRASLHGRPRREIRSRVGNSSLTRSHCSLVKSIYNHITHCCTMGQNYL